MEETKNSGEPTHNQDEHSLSKDYLGTGIAKTYQRQHATVHDAHGTNDAEREPVPMEVKRCFAWAKRNHNAVIAFSSIGIFFVTFVYAVFAGLQWCATRTQGELSAKQLSDFEAVQAARLVIEDVQMKIVYEPTLEIIGTYKLRNAGQTAAEHISGSGTGNARYYMSPEIQCDAIRPSNESPHSLLQGQMEEHTFGTGIGTKDIAAAEAGHLRIRAWDQWAYYDVFGNSYTTSVCQEWVGGVLRQFHTCHLECK